MKYSFLVKALFISCLLSLTSCTVTFNTDVQNKSSKVNCDSHKTAIIEAIADLSKIVNETNQDEARKEKIRRIVERFDHPKDLATLARMSRALVLHNGYAECIQGSELYTVYDEAFWHSIKILAKRKDEEAKRELTRLREGDALYGTDKGFFDSIVEEK